MQSLGGWASQPRLMSTGGSDYMPAIVRDQSKTQSSFQKFKDRSVWKLTGCWQQNTCTVDIRPYQVSHEFGIASYTAWQRPWWAANIHAAEVQRSPECNDQSRKHLLWSSWSDSSARMEPSTKRQVQWSSRLQKKLFPPDGHGQQPRSSHIDLVRWVFNGWRLEFKAKPVILFGVRSKCSPAN